MCERANRTPQLSQSTAANHSDDQTRIAYCASRCVFVSADYSIEILLPNQSPNQRDMKWFVVRMRCRSNGRSNV